MELADVIEILASRITTLERELASKQSVIEALQANIADLTRPADIFPSKVWTLTTDSSTSVFVDLVTPNDSPQAGITFSLNSQQANQDAKPPIPSTALLPAKLPRFF
jgi:hypothetical protein